MAKFQTFVRSTTQFFSTNKVTPVFHVLQQRKTAVLEHQFLNNDYPAKSLRILHLLTYRAK